MMLYVAFILMTCPVWAEVVMMNPTLRLKANIAADSLSRIAVVNDRITQLFGDQDAYEIVMDETLGQVFIKSTVANGNKPLSLSLVTESQCTQDLILTPTEMEAATLLFQNPSPVIKASRVERPGESDLPSYGVLDVMKRWILDEDVAHDTSSNPSADHFYSGCSSELLACQTLDRYIVSRWKLTNDTSTPLQISEESFYQQGDRAIVIQNKTLGVGQHTIVYVVSDGGPHA